MAQNIIKVFHADHGISQSTMQLLLDSAGLGEGFFLKTLWLPNGHPPVESLLYGPLAGDAPVPESEVIYKKRSEDRPESRMVNLPRRTSKRVTIIGIAGPDGVTVFTCYGGEAAPREPGDKSLTDTKELQESKDFWAQHALAL